MSEVDLPYVWGTGKGAYGVLVGRPEGRRPLGRPELGWEDNIKMDLQKLSGSITCGEFLD